MSNIEKSGNRVTDRAEVSFSVAGRKNKQKKVVRFSLHWSLLLAFKASLWLATNDIGGNIVFFTRRALSLVNFRLRMSVVYASTRGSFFVMLRVRRERSICPCPDGHNDAIHVSF